jgi:hypothetical protein
MVLFSWPEVSQKSGALVEIKKSTRSRTGRVDLARQMCAFGGDGNNGVTVGVLRTARILAISQIMKPKRISTALL